MKSLLVVCLFFTSLVVFAQGDVDINVKGNRVVEKANRLASQPRIVDTFIPTPEIDYPRLNLQYSNEITVDSIQSAEVKITDRLPQLYNSYGRIGVGSEFMPLGELYLTNTRSRKYHYGAHLNHLSSYGNLNDYAPSGFDRNRAEVYGRIIKSKYDLGSKISYRNDGFNYYGFQNDSMSSDSIKQRFSDFTASLDYNYHKRDSGHFNYRLGAEFNLFSTKTPLNDTLEDWRIKEQNFALRLGGSYLTGIHLLDAALTIQHNNSAFGTADSTISNTTGSLRQNTLINLNPSATTHYLNNRLKARAGMKIMVNIGPETRAYLYPDFEVKYSLFNDIFIPYAGLGGGMTQRSFKSISTENTFVIPGTDLVNENNRIEFYGGVKGTISRNIGFNLGARFSRVQDLALFVLDTLDARQNQFQTIYDTLNRAVLEGSVYFQDGEKLKIEGIGKYYSYLLLNNSYAWHQPLISIGMRGRYNLYEKLIIQADFNLYGGRKALVYADGVDVTIENDQFIKKLKDIYDFNLSIEYLYNKRVSAFIQFNNVAAQNYQRWHNYPVQGFQALGGVSFKF
jgi:hypothetical protein